MGISALLGGLLVLVALALLTVAALGWRQTLPRNRFIGVRTPASLRSDETFRLANRVAAPALLAGGVACLLGGGVTFGANGAALVVVAAVSGFGAVALAAAGGVQGHRAAEAVSGNSCGGCGCREACGAADQLRDRSVG